MIDREVAHREGEDEPGHAFGPVEDDDEVGADDGEQQLEEAAPELENADEEEGGDEDGVVVARSIGRKLDVQRRERVGNEKAKDELQYRRAYQSRYGRGGGEARWWSEAGNAP